MTNETETKTPPSQATPSDAAQSARQELLPLPGLAAICFYLLILAGVIVIGVLGGRHYPPLSLFFAAGFIAAGAGLMRLKRWAWSLAQGAVFLLVVYNLWIFASLHEGPALAQGLLNLVFFLYLARTEVRDKLR
jgi:hypothetical protein